MTCKIGAKTGVMRKGGGGGGGRDRFEDSSSGFYKLYFSREKSSHLLLTRVRHIVTYVTTIS